MTGTDFAKNYLEESLRGFHGLKKMAEKTFAQLAPEDYFWKPEPESNSIAIIIQHITGNQKSRWTDFLTTDGEKANRNRDTEFEELCKTPEELMQRWENGWKILFEAVDPLTEADLLKTVLIREEPHTVIQAIERQLRHYAIHIGQIVQLAKIIRGANWQTLSTPKKR